MSTIIVGDVAEGQKWWGQVEFLKRQLVTNHLGNNTFMSTWKQLAADVKVFINMVAGRPRAFIYVDGGYEFFTPGTLDNYEESRFLGADFYEGAPNLADKALYYDLANPDFTSQSIPCEIWYSEQIFVVCQRGARYRNIFTIDVIPPRKYTFSFASSPLIHYGSTKSFFLSGAFVAATAVRANLVLGIDNEFTSIRMWDLRSPNDVAYIGSVIGSWYTDTPGTKYALGSWAFNRDATRACGVVWAYDPTRFGLYSPTNPDPHIGWRTSYIVELQFGYDENDNLTSIDKITEAATDEFCIAVDYDWTTEENELVYATLSGHDYRIANSIEWVANSSTYVPIGGGPAVPYAIGDKIKTTLSALSAPLGQTRPGNVYEIIAIATLPPEELPPNFSATKPTHTSGDVWSGDFQLRCITEDTSAMDVWLDVKRYHEATTILSYELCHNRDYQNTASSAGTWYEGGGDESFITDLTGLDLRVRGVTACSPNGATYVTMFDRQWTSGVDLPSSVTARKPANFYHPDKLYKRFKLMDIPQTISAIPYLTRGDGLIQHACVYAPHLDPATLENNPDLAIDFRIDYMTDGQGEPIMGYHRDTYVKYNESPPYLNRYFVSGAWARRKIRP